MKMMLPCLPAGLSINEPKDDGFTALHLASLNNHVEAVQLLLNAVCCSLNNALHSYDVAIIDIGS